MGKKKTKVVLDADIINHFSRGGRLSLLPNILPEFQFIVLHIVNIRKLVNAASVSEIRSWPLNEVVKVIVFFNFINNFPRKYQKVCYLQGWGVINC